MLTVSTLFKRLFSLLELGDQDTLFGVISLGVLISLASSFLAILVYVVAFGVGLGTAFLDNDFIYTASTASLATLSAAGSMLIGAISLVALSYATVQYFNGRELPLGKLITDSIKYAVSGRGFLIAILGSILIAVSAVGYIFLIIPGIILTVASYFTVFRMIDFNERFGQALSNAFGMMKGHYVTSFLFIAAYGIGITLLSLFSCGIVGMLASSLNIIAPGLLYASVLKKPIFDTDDAAPQTTPSVTPANRNNDL